MSKKQKAKKINYKKLAKQLFATKENGYKLSADGHILRAGAHLIRAHMDSDMLTEDEQVLLKEMGDTLKDLHQVLESRNRDTARDDRRFRNAA